MEYIENFITEKEEQELISFINPDHVRKFATCFRNKSSVLSTQNTQKTIISNLLSKIKQDKWRIQINEYLPGQGIGSHIDDLQYGDDIIIISLMSEATMVFTESQKEITRLILKPRSYVKISGDYRYLYKHSILPVKDMRVSIVFRILKT